MILPPVDRNPSAAVLRQFGWTMGAALPIVALLVLWRSGSAGAGPSGAAVAVAGASVILGVTSWVCSRSYLGVARRLYLGWMLGTRPIGNAITFVLLFLLYFVFMLPFAMIVRAKDPLRRRTGDASYWEASPRHEPTMERMRKIF